MDLFGAPAPPAPPAGGASSTPKTPVTITPPGGFAGAWAVALVNSGGALTLEVDVTNQGQTPIQQFAVQLNKSTFGLAPTNAAIQFPAPVAPGATGSFSVPMTVTPSMVAPGPASAVLQVAIKNMHTQTVFYFQYPYPLYALFKSSGLDSPAFQAKWGTIDPASAASSTVTDMACAATPDAAAAKLSALGLPLAVRTPAGADGVERAYFSAMTMTNCTVLLELAFKAGFNGAKVTVRCDQVDKAEVAKAAVESMLRLQ